MSHQLTKTDSMFSVREMPWHGLGAVLDDYPTSTQDALEKSGLGWEVEPWTVYVGEDREGKPKPVEEWVANVRSDNGDVLGIVGADYEVTQNVEAFNFLDEVLGTDLAFETAGSLYGGKWVWVLARRPDFVEVAGDPVGTYVYIATSHDGSMAVTASVSPVRIVCANTLGMALRHSEKNAQRTFRLRHTSGIAGRMEEARDVMGITVNYEQRFKAMGDKLGKQKITEKKLKELLENQVLALPTEHTDRAVTNQSVAVEAIMSVFRGEGPDGDTRGAHAGTRWTAFNAVAEYADWGRLYQKGDRRQTNQMLRSFEDRALKQRALDVMLTAK